MLHKKKSIFENGFSVIFTFVLVTITWIFFRAQNVDDALYIIKQLPEGIRTLALNTSSIFELNIDNVTSLQIGLGLFFIVLMETIHVLQNYTRVRTWLGERHWTIRWAIYYTSIILIIGAGVFENKQFIYFQF